jgi:hypothetical protein
MEPEAMREMSGRVSASGRRIMPHLPCSGFFLMRRLLPRMFLIFVVLLLTGCPPEDRYVVNNFLGEDVQVQSTGGAINVRNLEAVTIRSYRHAFEHNKAGKLLLKIKSAKSSRCFILDISSYGIDPDVYYGKDMRSILQIVLLPDGSAYAIPYNHSAMAEIRSGSIKARPRFRQCSGPRRIAGK